MSTKDQLLYSALHGTAMRYAAERRNLAESIEELRESPMAATTSWPRLQRHHLGVLARLRGHSRRP